MKCLSLDLRAACLGAIALALGPGALAAHAAPAPANGSFTIGPDYTLDQALTDQGAPKGKRFQFTMKFADSKIFKGEETTLTTSVAQPATRTERVITVYVPAGYKSGDRAPVLIFFDGVGMQRGQALTFPSPSAELFDDMLEKTQNALDNLSASKDPARKVPPFVIVSVQNGGSNNRGSQRNLEYDTMSDRNARFLYEEVLPAVEANAQIKAAYPRFALTTNPEGRALLGCSSGSSAALIAAWFHPEWFRRVIGYSATLVDNQINTAPEDAKFPLGAWEFHSGQELIKNSPKKPLRVFNHVSEQDNGATAPEERHFNWVTANRRTAEALKAKGNDQRFVFSLATGHCDIKPFDQTLADTLVWTWQGYRP
jgi:enterochelin esterase-like enzyme